MKMTAAARASMHEMLTLPFDPNDYLSIDPYGSVWIYSMKPSRTQALFLHTTWQRLGPTHMRTDFHGIQINVVLV